MTLESGFLDDLDAALNQKEMGAKDLRKLLRKYGWQVRHPPKNQPHFFKEGVAEYIVVNERYGPNTIQKPSKWRKYVKRIKEHHK